VPFLVIDQIEYGPPEFAELLPVRCDVVRAMKGPDDATYFLVRPEPAPNYLPQVPTPLTAEQEQHYARNVYPRLESFALSQVNRQLLQYLPDGRIAVSVPGFVVTPRFPPNQFGPEMRDVWVNLAFVLDPAVMREPSLDFGALFFAAVVRMNLETQPAPTPAAAVAPASAAPVTAVLTGPIRYLELADRMGDPAGYIWVGAHDDRSGAILPEHPMPETATTVRVWTAALRRACVEGADPETLLAELTAATGDVLAGNLVPRTIAESPSLLAFSLSAGREMSRRNRERADIVPYGMPPAQHPALMVPTATEQQRIDALLAEALRSRDAVPLERRVLNAEPKFNTNFVPTVSDSNLPDSSMPDPTGSDQGLPGPTAPATGDHGR
jgi:hypothetical protein